MMGMYFQVTAVTAGHAATLPAAARLAAAAGLRLLIQALLTRSYLCRAYYWDQPWEQAELRLYQWGSHKKLTPKEILATGGRAALARMYTGLAEDFTQVRDEQPY